MKRCPYCGEEYGEEAEVCPLDRRTLVAARHPQARIAKMLAGPFVLTVGLVLWTAVVWAKSSYGSWQIYPALLVWPAVVIWHSVLWVRLRSARREAFLVGFCHCGILFWVWLVCLMLIAKDSV